MTLDFDSNPFVGLRAFETHECLLFFGREEQTLALLQRLHQFHFVAVIGSSGSGKSSLVRAGLIPRLKAGYLVNDQDRWIVSVMKPGQSPLYNLADALLDGIGTLRSDMTASALEEKMKDEGVDAVLSVLSPVWKEKNNLFLLVDQFEELFRFFLQRKEFKGKDDAIDFVNILLALTEEKQLPIYVVLTMRSDFIGDCAQIYGLPEAMNQSQYLVPRLNRIQLKQTIEGPVRLFGGAISAALLVKLLNDIQVVNDELPLLQHALMRLWDSRQKAISQELDIPDYKNIGGIEKALSNHADEALQEMTAEDLVITKKMFQALTAIDENGRKVRRPVRLSDLEAMTGSGRKELLSLIDRFIKGGKSFLILTRIAGTDDMLVDISHESLIRQWSVLSAWVDEEAESARLYLRLTESAKLNQRGVGDLISGNELQLVLNWFNTFRPDLVWANRYSGDYGETIRFLKDSEKQFKALELQKEKQRRRARRNRALLFTALVLVIIIISAFSITFYNNDLENKKQLALNYWNSSHVARAANKSLDALQYLTSAAVISSDQDLIPDILLDAEAFLPLTCLRDIFSFESIVTSAVFSPDGKQILVVTNDRKARLIDLNSGRQLDSFQHKAMINSAVFSPDGTKILTASNDYTACLWEIKTHKQILCLMDDNEIGHAVFNPDGTIILTSGMGKQIRLWDVVTGENILSLENDPLNDLAFFNHDGKNVVVVAKGKTFLIWDVQSKKIISNLETDSSGKDYHITNAAYSPDGSKILITGSDNSIRLCEASTLKELFSMKQADAITSASFSPDGRWILTAGKDKTSRLWDTTGAQSGAEMKHAGPIYTAVFSPDGKWILTAGWDKTVRLWSFSAAADSNKAIVFRHDEAVNSVAFHPGGMQVLTAGNDLTARLWDPLTAKQLASFRHRAEVNTAVFSPDGKMILTSGLDSTARIWDLSGKAIATLPHDEGVSSAIFGSGEKLILTSGENGNIYIWNTATPTANPIEFSGSTGNITSAVFSADAKKILIASGDSTAHVLDVQSEKQILTLRHEDLVTSAVYSDDEKKILTSSWDMTARLWDAVTGRQIGPSMKHNSYVSSARFSADGKWIVTSGWDSTVRIWSTITFKEIGKPKKTNGVVNEAVFSPDGNSILTANSDRNAILYQLSGDLDLPVSIFNLQTWAVTGTDLNVEINESQCVPTERWRSFKQLYNNLAREHYKSCRYPESNLWHRLNPAESP